MELKKIKNFYFPMTDNKRKMDVYVYILHTYHHVL